MNSTKKTARFAGTLYILLVLTGVFSLIYVPTALVVFGDAAATAGFADQSHFGRESKKATGLTPRQWCLEGAADPIPENVKSILESLGY